MLHAMNRTARTFTLLALLVCLPWAAHAAKRPKSSLRILHPYSFPTPAPGVVAVGFLCIDNTGASGDRLLSVSSPAVEHIEIHQMSMSGGVMKMRAQPDGIAVPAHTTVEFEPGGYHLMLFGPSAALKEGDQVPITLKFARAGAMQTELVVEPRRP